MLRVRRVSVTIRVQVAAEALRGTNPTGQTLFVHPGTARTGERFVPDQEIRFDVAPRNMNVGTLTVTRIPHLHAFSRHCRRCRAARGAGGAADAGMALIVALLASLVLSALGLSLLMVTAGTETLIAGNYRDGVEALHAADAALERVIADVAPLTDWSDRRSPHRMAWCRPSDRALATRRSAPRCSTAARWIW